MNRAAWARPIGFLLSDYGMLLVLVVIYAAVAFGLVAWLKSGSARRLPGNAQWRTS